MCSQAVDLYEFASSKNRRPGLRLALATMTESVCRSRQTAETYEKRDAMTVGFSRFSTARLS